MNIIECTNTANTTAKKGREIKYIVIHYTAGTTSKPGTAKSTAKYFAKETTKASADFIVDDENIVQYNPDIKNRYTWHCGGSKYKTKGGSLYKICTSANSIGIEMCSTNHLKKITAANDENWDFTDAVINNTVELVKKLCLEYDVSPYNVIRHYDVNGKLPLPIDITELLTKSGWKKISELNIGDEVMTYDMYNDTFYYDNITDILPKWQDEVLIKRNFEATYEHRMLHKPNSKNSKEWRINKWGELNEGKKSSLLKTCAQWNENRELNISDDFLRLIIWVQADGSYFENKQYLEFHFKKTRKINRVCEILNKLNIKYTICNQTNGTTKIRIYDHNIVLECEKYLQDKKFTWNLLNLSKHQFDILFDEIFKADGTTSNNKKMYFSTITENLNIIQALFTINNIRCKLGKTGHNKKIKYDSIVVHNSNYSISYKNKLEKRITDVTCVTVPSGLILVKQNNQTFITGNCPGVVGWNEDTNDISEWEDFKSKLFPPHEVIEEAEEIVEPEPESVIEEKPVEVKILQVSEKPKEKQEPVKKQGFFEILLSFFAALFKK